jgi:hypothetical protein
MDLQFILVPKDWIESIILPQITLVPSFLTEIIEKNTIQQIRYQFGNESELNKKQTFIINCFNSSYTSGLLSAITDIYSYRRLNISQFDEVDVIMRIYNRLGHKMQVELFNNRGRSIPSIRVDAVANGTISVQL